MKAKLDKDGYFLIARNKDYKQQHCPFFSADGWSDRCGDWCPLFGEPQDNEYLGTKSTKLTICQNKHITFDKFVDTRV